MTQSGTQRCKSITSRTKCEAMDKLPPWMNNLNHPDLKTCHALSHLRQESQIKVPVNFRLTLQMTREKVDKIFTRSGNVKVKTRKSRSSLEPTLDLKVVKAMPRVLRTMRALNHQTLTNRAQRGTIKDWFRKLNLQFN